MKQTTENLYRNPLARHTRGALCMILGGIVALYCPTLNAAAVVQRNNTTNQRATASRMPSMAARLKTVATTAADTADDTVVEETEITETITTPDVIDEIIIEDKSDQFGAILSESGTSDTERDDNSLAEMIRQQRAALDTQDAATAAAQISKNALTSNSSTCDAGLRKCMQTKCGTDFTKCSGDGDTAWGTKMDACRRDVECTGTEYRLFSAEIKSDRDMNARMASYNRVLECGNRYNDCIATQCDITYGKCLGRAAGDAAITACAQIARECTQQDSGLAARAMNVFATLRQSAEVQIKKDEQRLYELRDKMASQCKYLGAMFDERSLDCVFTVNFFAGEDTSVPYASKKAYAGSTFDCTQNWFGVDITTFKENAYRLTREQKSASSALLGSGLGMAVGAVTSGAISRAVDRQKAEKALDQAKEEAKDTTGTSAETSRAKAVSEAGAQMEKDKANILEQAEAEFGPQAPNSDAERMHSTESAQLQTIADAYAEFGKGGTADKENKILSRELKQLGRQAKRAQDKASKEK